MLFKEDLMLLVTLACYLIEILIMTQLFLGNLAQLKELLKPYISMTIHLLLKPRLILTCLLIKMVNYPKDYIIKHLLSVCLANCKAILVLMLPLPSQNFLIINTFCPKQSHELVLERIGQYIQYLKGTIKEGLILKSKQTNSKFILMLMQLLLVNGILNKE